MMQTLHIFRKDVRRFAYEIALVIALTLLWTWAHVADVRNTIPSNLYSTVAALILVLGYWYLIARLVHEEPLTGDRQFWITRPYSRLSLLAAKALFVLAFINLPLLLAGFAILMATGARPLEYLSSFLWMQLTFTAACLFLPAAVAALSSTLVQFVLAQLALYGGYIAISVLAGQASRTQSVNQSSGLAWAGNMRLLILLSAPVALTFLAQLRARRRIVSASVGLALAVLILLPTATLDMRVASAVESWMFGSRAAGRVQADLNADRLERDTRAPVSHGVALSVPLRIGHIPPGVTAAPELLEVNLTVPGGRHWSSGWIHAAATMALVFQSDPAGEFTWNQRIVLDNGFWRSARGQMVTVRGQVNFMLFDWRSTSLKDPGVTALPSGGQCIIDHPASKSMYTRCWAPFHMPFQGSDVSSQPGVPPPLRLQSVWDSPLPDFGMSPLSSKVMASAPTTAFMLRYDPHAYLRRFFEARYVRLPTGP